MVLPLILFEDVNSPIKSTCILNFNQFDPTSEKLILKIPQPGSRQNGGQVFFGPKDGYLYITTGDGGIRNGSRFDKKSLLGKILRLNVTTNITIPPDNPFVGEDARGEIYAYGFRNPWRCTADSEWIICGDVGEPGRNEEDIDVIFKGGIYGWLDHPNASCTSIESCQNIASPLQSYYHLPVHSYSHTAGQAVVGGIIYKGSRFRHLIGSYIFADYIHGTFHTLRLTSKQKWVKSDDLYIRFGTINKQTFVEDKSIQFYVTGLFEDLNGEVYITGHSKLVNSKNEDVIFYLASSNSTLTTDFGWLLFFGALLCLYLNLHSNS